MAVAAIAAHASTPANESRAPHVSGPGRDALFPAPASRPPQEVLYGYVGTDDYTLDPIIRPGAFVQIDPEQNKVIPRYLAERTRTPGLFCGIARQPLCGLLCANSEGNYLLLVPSPKSPVPIRHLRYPQDADIVGRVVGFAHLIAPLHSKTVALAFGRFGVSSSRKVI